MRRRILSIAAVLILLITSGCGGGSKGNAGNTDNQPGAGSAADTRYDADSAGAGETQNVKNTGKNDNNRETQTGSDSEDNESNEGDSRKSALMQDSDRGLFMLVNKQHTVGADYVPDDLVRVKYVAEDRSPAGWNMRSEAAEHFNQLSEAASAQGYEIVVTTAYRSYSFQKSLWDSYVAQDGEAAASTYSARPGTSEHQTGLAADVSSPEVGYAISTDAHYERTAPGKWLADNCYKYGFIIRFPDGRENITGYTYEPWHIRYVGTTAAKEIYDADITLEEYLEQNPFLDIE